MRGEPAQLPGSYEQALVTPIFKANENNKFEKTRNASRNFINPIKQIMQNILFVAKGLMFGTD